MSNTIVRHYPVMAKNVIQRIKQLKMERPLRIADCNFGFGGHSHLILKTFPKCFIQGFDVDPSILQYYHEHFHKQLAADDQKRLHLTNSNFTNLATENIFQKYDIILTDFGFNSYHLQNEKGFSWLKDQPLDMRYNMHDKSCHSIINTCSQVELNQILLKFGQIKEYQSVVKKILQNRPIQTTKQLKDLIVSCFQTDKTRKITQVFQAFRIATNHQLKDIQTLCEKLEKVLQTNGLVMAITFHSLERDIIYKFIKQNLKLFSKIQLEEPTKSQLEQNPKSHSAKMLSFRKK